jgi:hypothetical protein
MRSGGRGAMGIKTHTPFCAGNGGALYARNRPAEQAETLGTPRDPGRLRRTGCTLRPLPTFRMAPALGLRTLGTRFFTKIAEKCGGQGILEGLYPRGRQTATGIDRIQK